MTRAAAPGDLFFGSATQLAAAIRTRDVSSEEITRARLDRIEAIDKRLNAPVQIAAHPWYGVSLPPGSEPDVEYHSRS